MNYNLCPQATLEEIAPQLVRVLIHLHGQAGQLDFDPYQIYLRGQSAGGHLTALLLTTDFSQLDSCLPESLIKAGISISGLFDLAPLIPTSINTALNLNRERARALSPLHMTPAGNTPLLPVLEPMKARNSSANRGTSAKPGATAVSTWKYPPATISPSLKASPTTRADCVPACVNYGVR